MAGTGRRIFVMGRFWVRKRDRVTKTPENWRPGLMFSASFAANRAEKVRKELGLALTGPHRSTI